ncbi:MAG: hypothetical protein ACXWKA_09235 [Xanthobacteraceae bacterium]
MSIVDLQSPPDPKELAQALFRLHRILSGENPSHSRVASPSICPVDVRPRNRKQRKALQKLRRRRAA